jgi:hypothetical protein
MTDKNFSQQSLVEYGTLKNTDIQATDVACRYETKVILNNKSNK